MLNPKVILLLFGAVALATCGVIDQDDKADGVDEDNDNESNVKCVLLFYFRIFLFLFCFNGVSTLYLRHFRPRSKTLNILDKYAYIYLHFLLIFLYVEQ